MQPDGLPLQSLTLKPAIDAHFLTVAPDTTLVDVLALMSQFRSCMLPSYNTGNNSDGAHIERGGIYCETQEEETAFDVADTAAGCVLVMEGSQLLGVFTERDVVRLTAADIPFGSVKIGDIMTQPAITLKQSQALDIFTALGLFRQHRIRHLPIVDEQGKPVGIVTHESIRRALQPVNLLTRLRHVKDVMTTRVIHAQLSYSVLELAKLMTEYQVSCVVICQSSEELKVNRLNVEGLEHNLQPSTSAQPSNLPLRGTLPFGFSEQVREQPSNLPFGNASDEQPSNLPLPFGFSEGVREQPSILQPSNLQPSTLQGQLIPIGIVTERDIVQFQALELDLSRTHARDVMSTPLFSVQPDDSLWLAHEQMQRHRVRRLIVVGNQGELLGIVSQTSLLKVLNPADMYGVIEILQQAVEERTSELKQTNEQLRHEIAERQRAELELLQARDQLKRQVEERTAQLSQANAQLKQDILERQQVEVALRKSEAKLRKQATQLQQALQELHTYQTQLIQTEKMSSLGQLVAGVAHEINNPINFVYGNIAYANQYIQDIMYLLEVYEQHYSQPVPEIQEAMEKIDLNFVKADLPKLINSMKLGSERIRDLVVSLRNFSRLDEAEMKAVNLHDGIDSTLLILQNQLKATAGRSEIILVKDYGNLPRVECYPGQLNQVLMNLLTNAIDALEESRKLYSRVRNSHTPVCLPSITIRTGIKEEHTQENSSQSSPAIPHAVIRIADNGLGMSETVRRRLFDPFFTTKSLGKGTGLGLSISYQIVVEKHGGSIQCISAPGQGTEFVIEIPIWQRNRSTGISIA